MSSYMSCPPYCAMPKDLGLPEEGYGYVQAPPEPCPNGQVLKEIQGGIDRYGNEVKTEFRCVAPQSELDCPANTRFYKPIRGINTQAKCIPYTDADNPEKVECNDGSFDVIYGIKAPCSGNAGGVKQTNPSPTATEEDKYKSFLLYAMIGVGLYLIISK